MNSLYRTMAAVLLTALAATAFAQSQPPVTVAATPVAEGISAVTGAGGNIGVVAGPEGVLLIDGGYDRTVPQVKAAVAGLSDKPLRFLINTHGHQDHMGSNLALAQAGATIVAHEAVRARLATGMSIPALNRIVPPAPEKALPAVTFDSKMISHFAGHAIELRHIPLAHTDGDTVVHFRKDNVIHVGDLLFNGTYPYIDYGVGGPLEGMIAAADRLLASIDDKTTVIPGHGPVTDKGGLTALRDMLAGARDRIVPLVKPGKTKAEVVAAKPTQEWDER